MSDATSILDGLQRQSIMPAADAVAMINDNPEQAVRAIQLSKATGVPAPVIAGDLETFEAGHKATAAGDIIRNNSHIAEYIRQNPMASRVSNDDYGNLDQASQTLGVLARAREIARLPSATIGAGISGFGQGFAEGFQAGDDRAQIGSWITPEDWVRAPLFASTMSVLMAPLEGVIRLGSGAIKGAEEGVRHAAEVGYTGVGGDRADAKRFARDLAGIVQMQTTPGAAVHGPGAPPAMKAVEVAAKAAPWLEARKEPPRGLDPVIDQMKVERNKQELETLDQALTEAQQSTTRERDPDMYAQFARQAVGERSIGISGDAIAEMYKDKVPEPNDGLLGWVPNIAEQIELARDTGQDIHIPVADWVAKVDPALAKTLHDDIRVRPGNITTREALEVPPPQALQESLSIEGTPSRLEVDRDEFAAKNNLPPFSLDQRINFIRTRIGQIERDRRASRVPGEDLTPNGELVDLRNRLQELTAQRQPEVGPLNGPLAQVRAASALEPMFSIGDKRLKIERLVEGNEKYQSQFGPEQGFHDFKMVDEVGNDVGVINLAERDGGKTLYVDYVQGVGGHGPRAFGPTLMRSLLAQIKEQFPNAEKIGGFRVSGARDAVGKIGDTYVRLDNPAGWGFAETANEFQRILEGGTWESWSPTSRAYIVPDPARSAADKQIIKAVNEELGRIVPREVAVKAADRIEAKSAAGVDHPVEPSGIYIRSADTYPIILYSLEGFDPLGTARHEAIHHLRNYGFFKPNEWAVLEKASKDNGWIEQFGIDRRYETGGERIKLEESIADAYKAWAAGKLEAMPEVRTVFQKMKEFFDQIVKRIGEILGKDNPTWEDVFARVESGEVGSREGNKPLDERSFQRLSIEDSPEGKAQRQDVIQAAAAGLPVDTFKRLQRLIEKRNAEDIEATTKRVEREERKRQTKEWKDEAQALRPEVITDIKARPDVATDLFLTSGELFGQKVGDTFRMRTEDFTPEQQALMPKHYLARAGLAAEDVAHMFGFPSKDALADRMGQFTAERAASGKNTEAFRRDLIDKELNRRLEAKLGNLEDNIIDAATDHVLGQTQIDLLAEEMHAVGLQAGRAPVDKAAAKAWVEDTFAKQNMKTVSSEGFLHQAFKNGKHAETELIKGNPVDALHFMERRYLNTLLAQQAKALEKAQVALDKTARVYLRREPPKAVEAAFTDHISKLLADAGYKVRRNAEDLERSMEFHGEANLSEFTNKLAGDGWDPAVSEPLKVAGAKPIEAMTVAEFREFKDAIDSLNHIGREIRKIEVAGEKVEFNEFKKSVIDNITQLPARPRDKQGRWMYNIDASLTRMEEVVKDLDLRQELGPLWDAVIRPMELSKTKEFDLMSELSEHFRKTKGDFGKKWRKSLGESLPNDVIFDPYSQSMFDMTRENLIQIMLNWGNRSNIEKYTQGAAFARFGRRLTKEELPIYEAQIKEYIDTHARAEDWQFVQRMWEPFKGWQKEMDVVARNTSGVAPKWIDPAVVDTPHGQFEGGYWPVKYDKLGSGIDVVKDKAHAGTDGVFGTDYFRAATSKGYLKERTGYVDFVDISTSIEQAAATMQQTMHDIAFRDALMQGSKVFYDKDIRAAIRKHYGQEYEAQLVPWLKRISYQFATDDAAMKGFNDFLRRARINLVGHSLPLSLKVILSPDIGVPNPAAWARFEANRKENVALALERSAEIRHMVYNMDRDYNDTLNRLTADFGADSVRRKAVEWGYKPMMAVSQEFRMSTFVDKYYEAKTAGRTDTEAALIADIAVRERHGAASIVDLPAALSSSETMKMITVFQGYFNTMYNWQRQIPGNVRRREWSKAGVNTLGSVVVGSAFGALLFNKQKEDDSWFKTIAKALAIQPLSTVPILSHTTQMAFEGFAPRLPFASMLSAAGSAIGDINKAVSGKKVEKPVQHTANVIGLSTGLPLAQIGRTGEFIYDTASGQQRPRNIGEWARGIITGEARLKK